jgi:hypothetical protein
MVFGIETLLFPAVCCSKRIPQHNAAVRSSPKSVTTPLWMRGIDRLCSLQRRRTLVAAFLKQAELPLSIVIALLNAQ